MPNRKSASSAQGSLSSIVVVNRSSWLTCAAATFSPPSSAMMELASCQQLALLDLRIKQRPIPPRTPHLNGKVERVQKTLLDEFCATTRLDSPTLADDLGDWLLDYNYHRVHGSLGMTPMHRFAQLAKETPYWDDIAEAFDRENEASYVDQLLLKWQFHHALQK